MNDSELNYEEIIKEYANGNLVFSINLPLARQYLLENTKYSAKYYFWTFTNWILFPLIILVTSIHEMGFLGGIIYSFISFIFYLDISGSSSLNFNYAKTTFVIFTIIGIILKLFININLGYNFLFTLAQYISVYFFYVSIGKTVIDKILLVNKEIFFSLNDHLFFIKR